MSTVECQAANTGMLYNQLGTCGSVLDGVRDAGVRLRQKPYNDASAMVVVACLGRCSPCQSAGSGCSRTWAPPTSCRSCPAPWAPTWASRAGASKVPPPWPHQRAHCLVRKRTLCSAFVAACHLHENLADSVEEAVLLCLARIRSSMRFRSSPWQNIKSSAKVR